MLSFHNSKWPNEPVLNAEGHGVHSVRAHMFTYYGLSSLVCLGPNQTIFHSTSPSVMICDGLFFLFVFIICLLLFSSSTETSEEPLVDLSDVLNTDADIFGMLGKPSSDSGAS